MCCSSECAQDQIIFIMSLYMKSQKWKSIYFLFLAWLCAVEKVNSAWETEQASLVTHVRGFWKLCFIISSSELQEWHWQMIPAVWSRSGSVLQSVALHHACIRAGRRDGFRNHTQTHTHSSSPEPALPTTPDLVHAMIRLLLEKKSQRLHSCVWTEGQPRVPPLILHTTPSHAHIQGSYQSLIKVGAAGVLEFISQAAHIYSVETSSSLSGSETRLSQSD